MKFVNVREFRLKVSEFLGSKEPIIITKYGKPISRLEPVSPLGYADLAQEMGRAFRRVGISQDEALEALREVRSSRKRRRTRRR